MYAPNICAVSETTQINFQKRIIQIMYDTKCSLSSLYICVIWINNNVLKQNPPQSDNWTRILWDFFFQIFFLSYQSLTSKFASLTSLYARVSIWFHSQEYITYNRTNESRHQNVSNGSIHAQITQQPRYGYKNYGRGEGDGLPIF